MDLFKNLTAIEVAMVFTKAAHKALVDYEADKKIDDVMALIQETIADLMAEATDE